MSKHLTIREQRALDWIKSYQQQTGGYPTYREIQTALNLSSINSVSQYIRQLSRKGAVELIKNKGYRLPEHQRPGMVVLPLLGMVQAGSPNSTQLIEESMALPQQFVSSTQRSFLLTVRGDSMSDVGIHEGDMVIVNADQKPEPGDVVVALVDGETTVKRLARQQGKLYLKAESKNHSDIYPDGSWQIQGVVSGLWRKY
jgi:repressor LexA